MAQSSTDAEREHRISYEIIVDCYDGYEVAMGWYCYLSDRLDCPFTATWSQNTASDHSSEPETVQVIDMADEADCKTDILVDIEYGEQDETDVLSVPLAELEPLDSGGKRGQAIADWHYWLNQGNRLINPDEYEEC